MWITIPSCLELAIKSHNKYFSPLVQESGALCCTVEVVSELSVAQPRSLTNSILKLLRAVFCVKLWPLNFRCTFTLKTATEMDTEMLEQFQRMTWPHDENPSHTHMTN